MAVCYGNVVHYVSNIILASLYYSNYITLPYAYVMLQSCNYVTVM